MELALNSQLGKQKLGQWVVTSVDQEIMKHATTVRSHHKLIDELATSSTT